MCSQILENNVRETGRRQKDSSQQYYNKWEKSRSDSVKWENTKCDFQTEQQTKTKDTEGKYSSINVERPNSKQDRNVEDGIPKSSQNIEGNKAQANQQKEIQAAMQSIARKWPIRTGKIMEYRDKMDKFSKMRHIFCKMLQIMVLLKDAHLVEENEKKNNIDNVLCSSKKDQILKIWHFHSTTPNNDLNIKNNMANKKWSKISKK